MFLYCSDKYPEVGLLDNMAALFFNFLRTLHTVLHNLRYLYSIGKETETQIILSIFTHSPLANKRQVEFYNNK